MVRRVGALLPGKRLCSANTLRFAAQRTISPGTMASRSSRRRRPVGSGCNARILVSVKLTRAIALLL